MLDPLFREAFCHSAQGHTVLGRKLHPLCAFDLLSLEAIDSPFLKGDVTVDASELILAVWLLSNPVPDDLTIGHLELTPAGETWLADIGPTIDMRRDCDLLQAYIADYYSVPEIISDKLSNPLTDLGAPWMLSTVINVCSKLHLPLRTAWTMGIGQLIWYRSAIAEMENPEVRIMGEAMRAEIAAARAPQVIYKMEVGETIEVFAARVNLPVEVAALMLHQGQGGK